MFRKFLSAVIVVCGLACAPAKAEVVYAFFDTADPSTVDFEFTVATQLTQFGQIEPFLTVGGVFGPDYAGGQVDVAAVTPFFFLALQAPTNPNTGTFEFTSLPPNVAPGVGSFTGSGVVSTPTGTVGHMASATVAVVVPEPATWVLLSAGFLGLAATGWRRVKRARLAT